MARTLLVQNWTFHTARGRGDNRQDFSPADLLGCDLYSFIADHVGGIRVLDDEKKRWVEAQPVRTIGARSLLVTAAAGAYNEPGALIDTIDGSTAFSIDKRHAAVSPTRSLFIIPDVGLHAIAFYERSTGRGASGLDVLKSLQQSWRDTGMRITWAAEWLMEADAWLQAAKLKAVNIRRYRGDMQTVEPDAEELGEYVFVARAAKNKFFRKQLLEKVLADPREAHALFGQEVHPADYDRVFVELHRDGRQKTYALEGGKLPRAQMQLEDGMSDDAFVAECITQASGYICPKLGVEWRPNWAA